MQIGTLNLEHKKHVVMGILNLTPDSFSDGGQFIETDAAVAHALNMIEEGADIIDIGGESTRPGASPLSASDEIARVVPVIDDIRQRTALPISIDTSKPAVMAAAIEAGANLVNDVRALQEEGARQMVAQLGVPVCLMHMQGEPRTMQKSPQYSDVVTDVKRFLQERIDACLDAGIRQEQIMIDPGFGFGKTLDHNLSLLKHLGEFVSMGLPVLVGISRKSMLGLILDAGVDQRLAGGLASTVLAYQSGAKIFRVHDVKPTVDALRVAEAVQGAQ